jgi:hypothetical protein
MLKLKARTTAANEISRHHSTDPDNISFRRLGRVMSTAASLRLAQPTAGTASRRK